MEQEEIRPRKVLSRLGLSLFIMAVVTLGVQIIIELSINRYAPEIFDTDWYALATTAVTVAGIGLPIFYLTAKSVPDSVRRDVSKLKVSEFLIVFFISVAAMYLASYFGYFISYILSVLKGGEIINPLEEVILGSNIWLTVLYGAIFGPIVEELIFRKILLSRLRRFGDLPAILLSGFAFGLFHMNLSQFFYATVLGFIFAYITLKTNTVRYSIILHIMINSIGALAAPLVLKSNNVLSVMAMGMWIVVSITLGCTFFFMNKKKIKLEKAEVPVDKKSVYFLNTGTILFASVCLYITVKQLMI